MQVDVGCGCKYVYIFAAWDWDAHGVRAVPMVETRHNILEKYIIKICL
jgi:hypothetical protein